MCSTFDVLRVYFKPFLFIAYLSSSVVYSFGKFRLSPGIMFGCQIYLLFDQDHFLCIQ